MKILYKILIPTAALITLVLLIIYLLHMANAKLDEDTHMLAPRIKSIYTQLSKNDWNTKSLKELASYQLNQKITKYPQLTEILQDSMRSLGPTLSFISTRADQADTGFSRSNKPRSFYNSVELVSNIKFKTASRVVISKLTQENNRWVLDSFNTFAISDENNAPSKKNKIILDPDTGTGTLVFNIDNINNLAVYLNDTFQHTKYLSKYIPVITALYKKAAKKGDTSAMYNLGLKYYKGDSGIPIQYKKALHWYQTALNTKCASNLALCDAKHCAAHDLALMYLHGYGVEKNLNKAKQLFQQSLRFSTQIDSERPPYTPVDQYARYMLSPHSETKNADDKYHSARKYEQWIKNDCWG